MPLLNEAERVAEISTLSNWQYDEARQGLARTFRFADFGEAFAFMVRVALEAEKADHHPDWFNAWNRVDILLTTHSAAGLTAKDIALARRIDAMAV
jgi:4a-hydroxytetrahydrobiopterin dehydratase